MYRYTMNINFSKASVNQYPASRPHWHKTAPLLLLSKTEAQSTFAPLKSSPDFSVTPSTLTGQHVPRESRSIILDSTKECNTGRGRGHRQVTTAANKGRKDAFAIKDHQIGGATSDVPPHSECWLKQLPWIRQMRQRQEQLVSGLCFPPSDNV